MQRNLILIFTLFLGCMLNACGGAKKSTRTNTRTLPPGLDSSTVVRANKFGEQNFVSTKREQKAARAKSLGQARLQKVDAFWAYLEKSETDNAALTTAQKTQFERALQAGTENLNAVQATLRHAPSPALSLTAKASCLEAQRFLEEAIRLNPFDRNARLMLAATYYHLQNLFGQEKNYAKAVEVLERLVRLEKGEHAIYRLLAENYLALNAYQLALTHYRRAEEVMRKLAFMTPPDTAMLFYYNFGQGDALARLHDGANALKAFEAARPFARTTQDRQDLERYLAWLNWDGGNTRASEAWDKVLEMERAKQFAPLAAACQNLLATVKTTQARTTVSHKLAVIEFEHLQRPDQAIARMQQVFESLSAAEREAPRTELAQVCLNTYGAMLYRLGVEARKQEQKKLSLAYFSKAMSFKWENAARVGLELLPLVWNAPEEAIKYGKLALAANHTLSAKENCQLMSMLIKAYKSAGQFDEARVLFEDWKKCQGEQHAEN